MMVTAHEGLADELLRTARLCEETLHLYAGERPRALATAFAGALLLAIAALQTAVESLAAPSPRRETALVVSQKLCRDAAEAARRHSLDEPVLMCAGHCEMAAVLCGLALRGD